MSVVIGILHGTVVKCLRRDELFNDHCQNIQHNYRTISNII